jgi:hypothetical protein
MFSLSFLLTLAQFFYLINSPICISSCIQAIFALGTTSYFLVHYIVSSLTTYS